MAEGRIFITGATGRLGRAVLRRLPGAIPLTRGPSDLPGAIIMDPSPGRLEETLRDASVLIHLAGSMDTLDPEGMRKANVDLTRRLVEAMPKGCRIILASSISVYGKRPGKTPADESTPIAPDSAYSRSKAEAERIVSSCQGHVILRIGTIYGPRYPDYAKVVSMIRSGKMRIIGRGENRVPLVHVDDVADALVSALEKGEGMYVIAGEPLSQRRIYEIVARSIGCPVAKAHIGYGLAMLLSSARELAHTLGGRRPTLTAEHIAVLGSDRVFDCSKARRELRFRPRPLEEGIEEMIEGMEAGSG